MNLPDKEKLDALIFWETPEQEKEVETLIDLLCNDHWRKGFDAGIRGLKGITAMCPFPDCPKVKYHDCPVHGSV